MNTPDPSALKNRVKSEERKLTLNSALLLMGYLLTLFVTIVIPLVIAGKDGLTKSVLGDIEPLVPVLALIVAAAAGVDRVVRTKDRWDWFAFDRNAARRLLVELETKPPRTDEAMAAYLARWEQLDNLHHRHAAGEFAPPNEN